MYAQYVGYLCKKFEKMGLKFNVAKYVTVIIGKCCTSIKNCCYIIKYYCGVRDYVI